MLSHKAISRCAATSEFFVAPRNVAFKFKNVKTCGCLGVFGNVKTPVFTFVKIAVFRDRVHG